MYHRMQDRPNNTDTLLQRSAKERTIKTIVMQYLSGTGTFQGWKEDRVSFEVCT